MSNIIQKISYKIKLLAGLSTRQSLFRILPKNAVCAELGVFRGDFSKEILKYTKPKEAHFVDVWWEEFGETYPDWGAYTDFGKLSTRQAFEEAKIKISSHPGNNIIHVGDDLKYLQRFNDKYFDWVYIDSSHNYSHTREELLILEKKIKPDGIICGHDWTEDQTHAHAGVRQAVIEFCSTYNWQVIYTDQYLQWAIRRKK